jgi:hypothetical protein
MILSFLLIMYILNSNKDTFALLEISVLLTAIRPFKFPQSRTLTPHPPLIHLSIMTPPPAWLSHPLFNVASFFVLGQLAKRMNLEDPHNLFYARAVYVLAQATIIGLCYWLMAKVDKKNGK